jgi:hypothetical protein
MFLVLKYKMLKLKSNIFELTKSYDDYTKKLHKLLNSKKNLTELDYRYSKVKTSNANISKQIFTKK